MRFHRIDTGAAQQQLVSLVWRQHARQQDGGDRREHAELDLGLAKLGVAGGNDHVAGQRQFAAATQCDAIQGGDHRNRHQFEAPENSVEHLDHAIDLVCRMVGHVDSGRKCFLAGAGNEQQAAAAIGRNLVERRVNLHHHLDVQHVEWRLVQRQRDESVGGGAGDGLEIAHCVFSRVKLI